MIWALDLETTGLDARLDAILSLGMVPIRAGAVRWGERFYALARPPEGVSLTREALRVHHIMPGEVAAASPIEALLPEYERRAAGAVLLMHWKPLDAAFLDRAYRRTGRVRPRTPIIDTVSLMGRYAHRQQFIDPGTTTVPTDLAGARRHFGLPAHAEHHALYDALATAELFLVLRQRLGRDTIRSLR
ncbi:MAG: 3'-5' exonuclease [Acidobacteria bacterium]|nr:3'-5' exonuclease [Acidobacteriota bacterium]